MAYIPPTTHVTPLATLRRERVLPLAGEVIVQVRDQVQPNDVVARAVLAEHHRLVDVAHRLGLPDDEADRLMLKRDGDPVKAGEPIAVRKVGLGLLKRKARSPVTGKLVAAAGGKALLAALSEPFELRAGLPGTVVTILQSKGVVIETTGALLEGVWGNGQQDFAPLRLAAEDPRQPLEPKHVEVELRGAIAIAGVLADRAALQALAKVGVRGLVVGSAASALLAELGQQRFPVLVVEGFGEQGLSAPAMAWLAGNAGREAWLNAEPRERFAGRRPELIVPLPSPGTPPPPVAEGEPLAPGKRVRVLRGPQAGRVGTVAHLSERLVATGSGLRARVASVAFEGEGEVPVAVPFANLELLE